MEWMNVDNFQKSIEDLYMYVLIILHYYTANILIDRHICYLSYATVYKIWYFML